MIKKIRSGGQTGADQGGLAAARHLGLMTGGWIPKGCLTEFGSMPHLLEKYGLTEHTSDKYPPRTAANVKDSDGTVWFGKTGSAGFQCTESACIKHHKPFRVIFMTLDLIEFIEEFKIQELNVAGNRESTNPGIFDHTYQIIVEALS